jgi:hypothetical protein
MERTTYLQDHIDDKKLAVLSLPLIAILGPLILLLGAKNAP